MPPYSARSVKVDAFIPAPPDEVFALVADTRNDPEWCPNVDHAELVDGAGVEVGASFRFHQHVERGSKRIEFDATVEIVDLGDRSINWRVEDRFQVRDISIMVEPEDDGTRITQVTLATFHEKPGLSVRYGYPVLARSTFKDQFRSLAGYFAKA